MGVALICLIVSRLIIKPVMHAWYKCIKDPNDEERTNIYIYTLLVSYPSTKQ